MVTLVIWSNLDDPFNAPKSWVLYVVGAYLLGWLVFQVEGSMQTNLHKRTLIFSAAFISAMFLSYLMTDQKYIGFFGEHARRTGFLTYFFLTVILVSASLLINMGNIKKFDGVVLSVGLLVGGYGFFQHFHIDIIKWNNPYNSVLSTLGNPDFASATMGILLILTLGIILNPNNIPQIRLLALANSLIMLSAMVFSQIRQGLVASAIGLATLVVAYIYTRNKRLGQVALSGSILMLIVGVFGMLNKGPLSAILYKDSVTLRGDYWRAAVNMFKSHPFFGVGLDRYGAYFRQFRDTRQVLHHGPLVVSNAAHSVPLQLLATAGIFVTATFLVLFFHILIRGLKAVSQSIGANRIRVISIFAAWITYEAQSFISIDNIGIAIWGWLLGGALIGLSVQSGLRKPVSTSKINLREKKSVFHSKESGENHILQPAISGLLATVMIAALIPIFLADSAMRMSRSYAKPTSEQRNAYITAVKKPLHYYAVDPSNKVEIASLLATAGNIDEAISMLQDSIARDAHDYEALRVLSLIYELTNRENLAIPYREKMIKLDPLNQQLLLLLGQDLKKVGNEAGMKEILHKIVEISPSTQDAKQAQSELK